MATTPIRPDKTVLPEGFIDAIGDAYEQFRRKRVVLQVEEEPIAKVQASDTARKRAAHGG
jgi:hypothetical protein